MISPTSELNSQLDRESSLINKIFRLNKTGRRILSLIIFFGLWQFLCAIKFQFIVNFGFLPTPIEVVKATWEFFTSDPWVHFGSSILRVLLGYAIASLLGIILGIFIGAFQKVDDLLSPPLELLRPIPAVAWIPLAILMFPTALSLGDICIMLLMEAKLVTFSSS